MKFINDDFLLKGKISKKLYHDFAEGLPIIDYHCHLNPKEIAENNRIFDLGELFLKNDHYKWRIMRSNGIEEDYITGNSSFYQKFKKFASCMPYCAGNPILHWTHLELSRYFKIEEFLDSRSADVIWEKAEKYMNENVLKPQDIIKRSNVEVICTTDDPADELNYHEEIAESGLSVKVFPTFRPDKVFDIGNKFFCGYISSIGINSYNDLLKWIRKRIEYFDLRGCVIADHSFETIPVDYSHNPEEVFNKRISGGEVTPDEINSYKYNLLHNCVFEYNEHNWVLQLHIGALRNNNTNQFNVLGADAGYDSINDFAIAEKLSKLLDSFEIENILPKTIIYNLNPKDNYVVGTMIGNFQKHPTPSKIQFGSGWWFNDQKDGIESQLTALGNLGVLGRFVGMLTDSRSLLSYTRHEYFRRVLCNLVGAWVEDGLYPNDESVLKELIQGICYYNAKKYFGF